MPEPSTLTILEGTTFCVCDELGDVGAAPASGIFVGDVRVLSLLRLTIDGRRPLLLTSRNVEYFSASFYLRNPVVDGLDQDTLLIVRERFAAGGAVEERIVVHNETQDEASFELTLELGADFADIFAVKERELALGPRGLPEPARAEHDARTGGLLFRDGASAHATHVALSEEGVVEGGRVRYRLTLPARGAWRLRIEVEPTTQELDRARLPRPGALEERFGRELASVRASLETWRLRMPRLRASWPTLQQAFDRSLADLAALRLQREGPLRDLPAAGMPWFMTLFGRDTLITCLQTTMLGPELALTALHALADLQAESDESAVDAEPGKIIHELRHGKAGDVWFHRYYGTVDATPLFLILLSELWRWTGDATAIGDLREPALRALAWIDEHGDRDGDGFVEYERRTPRGLEHQSWKDSDSSQRFADGRRARTPIAPCEVQGYVYDAKLRLAELAREAWRDLPLADRLERDAAGLAHRFDEAFWIPDRGGYYALGLDADKRPIDSLCSNIGHLLWSGIVPDGRVQAIVDRLAGAELWSGWGVRTMSSADAGYNPLGYHTGSVWPHDNSLIALGLARHGRREALQLLARRMLEAAAHFDHQLPEVFAGIRRGDAPFPVPYPTPGKPQAWAAATPILLLRLLLDLRPNPALRALETGAGSLPDWLGDLELSGVHAFGRRWDVRAGRGAVVVEEA